MKRWTPANPPLVPYVSILGVWRQEVQEVQEVQRKMRLVAGPRKGPSSDFGGLFTAWESPDWLVPRAVSRKALWRETPLKTASFCHSFLGLETASKIRKSEFSHALRLPMARLTRNGTQAQNCQSVCRQLRHRTATAGRVFTLLAFRGDCGWIVIFVHPSDARRRRAMLHRFETCRKRDQD